MVRFHARPRVRIQSTIYINLESGEFRRRKRTRRASRPVTHLLLIIRNDREEPVSSTALSRGDQLVRSLRVRSPSHAFFLTCAKREGTIPRYGDVALSRRSKQGVLTDHFRIRTVLPRTIAHGRGQAACITWWLRLCSRCASSAAALQIVHQDGMRTTTAVTAGAEERVTTPVSACLRLVELPASPHRSHMQTPGACAGDTAHTC